MVHGLVKGHYHFLVSNYPKMGMWLSSWGGDKYRIIRISRRILSHYWKPFFLVSYWIWTRKHGSLDCCWEGETSHGIRQRFNRVKRKKNRSSPSQLPTNHATSGLTLGISVVFKPNGCAWWGASYVSWRAGICFLLVYSLHCRSRASECIKSHEGHVKIQGLPQHGFYRWPEVHL